MTVVARENRRAQVAGRSGPLLYSAAALSFLAELIHILALPDHFQIWWGYGMFFLLVGAFQGSLGAALLFWPRTPVLLAGVLGNFAVIVAYVVTRSWGLPFIGPMARQVEEVGVPDLLATAAELGVIAALAVSLSGHPAGRSLFAAASGPDRSR